MKGLFTLTAFLVSLVLSGCQLTEKEKLKLADQIIITSPANTSDVSTSMVVVRANIPTSANAQSVSLVVDGIEVANDNNGAPWELNWPAYYYADGYQHTLLLKIITSKGDEILNSQKFQLTVLEGANEALGFNANLDGKKIKDVNTLSISFKAFPRATRYQVSYDGKNIETVDPQLVLTDLNVGFHEVRYRAIYDFSESVSLTGPWSLPATFEVIVPLPEVTSPIIKLTESGYEVLFSWDSQVGNNSYEIYWGKTGDILNVIGSTNSSSYTINSQYIGSYNWGIRRTNSLGQVSERSDNEVVKLGVFKQVLNRTSYDIGWKAAASKDGGAIVLGSSGTDDWFIKLDAFGNTEWEYFIESSGYKGLIDVIELEDGSILAIGYAGENWYDRKGYVVKLSGDLSPDNRLIWKNIYRGVSVDNEYSISLTENSGRIFILGYEKSCANNGECIKENFKLTEFNTVNGELQGSINIPSPDSTSLRQVGSIITSRDGNFLVSCDLDDINDNNTKSCLLNFSLDGRLNWSWMSENFSGFQHGGYVAELPFGGFSVIDHENSINMSLATFDRAGNNLSVRHSSGSGSYYRETFAFDDNSNVLRLRPGSMYPELWSVSTNGVSEKIKVFENLADELLIPVSIIRSNDGGILLLFRIGGIGNPKMLVIKTDFSAKSILE